MMPSTGPSPRLSIVIPATDAAALEDTLVSVLENRPADSEIIAALAVPYSDPWNIAEEVRFVQAPTGTGIAACTNLGVALSAGDVVHVLAAGWRATEGWADAAMSRFEDPTVGAVVPVAISADDRSRVVSAGVRRTRGGRCLRNVPGRGRERLDDFMAESVMLPSAPELEAGFWRADILDSLGFATACGDAFAAADMSAGLVCAGDCVVLETGSRVVAGQSVSRGSKYQEGVHAERLFWRSLAAEPVAGALVAHLAEVIRHAMATAPFGTLPMLAGRLTTLVQFGSCMRRTRQLEAIKSRSSRRIGERPTGDGDRRTLRIDEGHALPARRPGRRIGEAAEGSSKLRRSA
jgi:hypothetical protein